MVSPNSSAYLPAFSSWDDVQNAFKENEDIRGFVQHNVDYWRWVHGSLAMSRRTAFDFDPRPEYWWKTERRILVMFFAARFAECYAPAEAMRRLAFKTFRHFDRAREDGHFGEPVLADEGNWQELGSKLIEVADNMPGEEEYRELKRYWPRFKRDSFRDELGAFLERVTAEDDPDKVYQPFFKRLAWFPYLGLQSLDELVGRQRFFFGFYDLFASTNAYVHGGAMVMAPVLQNNPAQDLLAYVERWEAGETPDETGFLVEGKTDRRDQSHLMTVAELYGLLNLHRQPFYNNRTFGFFEDLAEAPDLSKFQIMAQVGESTHAYLAEYPNQVKELAAQFRSAAAVDLPTTMKMEGIALSSVGKRLPGELKKQVDHQLYSEIGQSGNERAQSFSDLEAACAILHLMLDAGLLEKTIGPPPPPPPPPGPGPHRIERKPKSEVTIRLPEALRMKANNALGYLRSGHHVLFAGPPGTGKTTLAQIVGHAWNEELTEVRDRIPIEDAPATTVGNSSWAPFHTIGGILPDGEGGFNLEKGIFIDDEELADGEWSLRGDCLVLDEMNRADLDRCVGELYPLLSRSVDRVYPAGIPGVRCISISDRFRIAATVNDATIDDVVFPISEGLARRFVRIELLGARMVDLEEFMLVKSENEDRIDAARLVLENLFETLRGDGDHLAKTEMGEHLPFGVGYFSLLRAWAVGDLHLSPEFEQLDTLDQASHLMIVGLRGAVRFRGLGSVLEKLEIRESVV